MTGRAALVGGTVWLLGPDLATAPAARAAPRGDRPEATVTEGTNISATASPDGEWIAFDLYSAIWLAPAGGGTARRLTGPLQDATRPHFAPDSRRLAFQAYAEGNFHIHVLDLDGGEPRRLTDGPHDHREPRFSPDGRTIALAADRGDGYGIWLYDLEAEKLTALTDSDVDEAEPSWSADGRSIVYVQGRESIHATTLDGRSRELVPAAPATTVHAPALAEDGETLAYVRAHADTVRLVVGGEPVSGTGEDVFLGALTWLAADRILYTADGRIRTRHPGGGAADIDFRATVPYRDHRPRPPRRDPDDTGRHPVRGIAGPVLSPDGTQVAFRALGALWVMPVGGRPRAVADDGAFNSDPDWHPDGRSLVYSSDREGAPALWRHHLDDGTDERLTRLEGAQLTPRWAPDGRRIAYQDEDGATWILDLDDGSTRQVLPALFQPGRPTWSADGATLALAAVRPRSTRFREGTSQILTVDLETGRTRYTEPAPYRSLSTRGDDGPVWSPDGTRMAFVMESVLWIADVDGDGTFTGEARQLTDEVTDAPSWSGDSRTLLYLNNGRLRRIAASGGRARTVPLRLSWKRSRPGGRTVIRAGALWDGTSQRLRRDVDIVIDGNRITEVRARGAGGDGGRDGDARIVDATAHTVMPGLVDAHVHWHLRGRAWGARQGPLFLAYGITTVRSPGDPVYQMLETREALDAGKQVGPRYFATGEAVDGSRVYYDFMRPTLDADQLDLEMERAFALDYDLIKTYVRLPVAMQRHAVEKAHAQGVPLTSHYLYPAVELGMDGMEHTGATNRLGYSHTVSTLGRSYADATTLFAASGMPITPTLFTSAAMYAEDRSLVEDERTRALFPPWEYEALVRKADAAGGDGAAARRSRAALPGHVAMLLKIHRDGGTVIGGTDAPLDNVAVSLHQNMRAMVRYGFTPYEALTVSTRTAAEWLGVGDDLGTVEAGKLADLAIVDGDPLADIADAAAVRWTVRNGEVHAVDDLVASVPAASATADRLVPAAAAPSTPRRAPLTSVTSPTEWWHGESERGSPHRC
ncbi:Tol biopolymer transport system component/imidazolonepropionase-like amidohydrolase [Nocardiopsis mwathae]|uniref:Tol biopolymer transport system component/imidazolonepropionase-like amidohydrolase n=1 Tax=Nocardiopsis mwathae TaxID=1472723 RepID=A0A7W9YE69_9ACTN|nr:Tol biopolymer transport system component/imidazolonepropionase-like amidohydrolase [Nocardiopsis mwathae]